jgi:hypothetical protein
MSRYDDLRRMREAEFAAAKTIAEKRPDSVTKIEVTKPVTKIDSVTKIEVSIPVTKIDSVTKIDVVTKIPVTKIGRGRPRLGDKPMTPAERMRRYRSRKASQATH